MRKAIVILIGTVVIAALAIVAGWPYVRMEIASSAYYTEQDKRSYEYYTPELLKKIPRISDDYKFEFGRITGTEANVFTAKFHGVAATHSIRNYLDS